MGRFLQDLPDPPDLRFVQLVGNAPEVACSLAPEVNLLQRPHGVSIEVFFRIYLQHVFYLSCPLDEHGLQPLLEVSVPGVFAQVFVGDLEACLSPPGLAALHSRGHELVQLSQKLFLVALSPGVFHEQVRQECGLHEVA